MNGVVTYIREQLPPGELLAQLAEEASELAHAALKLRRAHEGVNPTPVTFGDAWARLLEEIADVYLCLYVAGALPEQWSIDAAAQEKALRWEARLKANKEAAV